MEFCAFPDSVRARSPFLGINEDAALQNLAFIIASTRSRAAWLAERRIRIAATKGYGDHLDNIDNCCFTVTVDIGLGSRASRRSVQSVAKRDLDRAVHVEDVYLDAITARVCVARAVAEIGIDYHCPLRE